MTHHAEPAREDARKDSAGSASYRRRQSLEQRGDRDKRHPEAWSPRQTALFVIGSSIALWVLLIGAVAAVSRMLK